MKNTKLEVCMECEDVETSSRSPIQNILKQSITGSTLEEENDENSSSSLDQDSTDAVINSLDDMNSNDSQEKKTLLKPIPTKDSEDSNRCGLTKDGLPDPEAKGACHLSCFLYRRNRSMVTHINLDDISCRRLHNPIKNRSRN